MCRLSCSCREDIMYTWVHYFRKDGGHLPLVVREDILESLESSKGLMCCVKLCGGQSSSDLLEPRAERGHYKGCRVACRKDCACFFAALRGNLRQLTEHLLPVQTATATSSWGRGLALKWPTDQPVYHSSAVRMWMAFGRVALGGKGKEKLKSEGSQRVPCREK